MTEDHRGWKQGNRRKMDTRTEDRIKQIHRKLNESEQEFFTGATAVSQTWLKRYEEAPPLLRTIGQIMKDLGLPSHPRGKSRGAAKYLHYPETTIYGGYLGNRVMEADFILAALSSRKWNTITFCRIFRKKSPKVQVL